MRKTVTLMDGTEVALRPIAHDDRDASVAFFRELPPEDRLYLRADVTRPEVIDRRFARMEAGELRCLVAVVDGRIVADGALEIERREWKAHLAEMRMFVAEDHRRRGLGVLLTREVYGLALEEKVEEIVVRMMRPQVAARRVVEKLGFHEDAVLEGYVRDLDGVKQDLVVMRCDVGALWRRLEHYLIDSDWQRTR